MREASGGERTGPAVAVLLDRRDRQRSWERSANHYGGYVTEILEHAGIPFQALQRSHLRPEDGQPRGNGARLPPIVLLPYPVRLAAEEVEALRRHLDGGGAVIACGGVEGADDLFGIVDTRRYLDEAVLRWPEGGLGLAETKLPVWGAQLARVGDADSGDDGSRQVVGELAGESETGVACTVRKYGHGFACYLAFDVPRSVVTMQQGRPVTGDAAAAPDGSAPLDDRILKSDDGAVIDWSWRRQTPEGPAFATPYADMLREVLLAALASAAEAVGVPLPMVWYWPEGLPAVATLSFDTDSNEGPDGWAFLAELERLEVRGTWCVMFPGGYPRELYDAIRERGDEIALHFDGLTTDLNGSPHCGWSRDDFEHQHRWLLRETGIERAASQKNHVTRWEGWVELFRWLELAGIAVDQTKGPSKIGNLGFTFGTCHPCRPLEDLRNDNRIMSLLELPFLAHDMHHSSRRVALRRQLLDSVREHAGVAHFVFHPQRIHETGMREALTDLVEYGRERGLQWWTSEEIARWEEARRRVRVRTVAAGSDGEKVRIEVDDAPDGLTLMLFGLRGGSYASSHGGEVEWVELLGRSALRLTLLPGGGNTVLELLPDRKS